MSDLVAAHAELFRQAPCGLARLDVDYAIHDANAYFLDLVGLSPPDLAESPKLTRFLSVAGRIFLQTRMQQELALTGRLDEMVLDVVRADSTRVPVMLNAVQQIRSDGRPGDILISAWRAAAKRAYEAEVPKARLEAEEAGRVKADFLANVSHELRTPLNGVIGVAAVLAASELTAEHRKMVDLIHSSSLMLERILSDILDVSKVQAGGVTLELAPFDLATEMSGVVDITRLRAVEKGLAFHAEVSEDAEGRYLGDAVRIKQVLGNLASNALKFTEQGELRISLALDQAGAIIMEVADTGIGFDEASAADLFLRFHQADTGITRRFGGTGLGLAICKTLVEAMGGTISAQSRLGEGSRFTVRLPLERLAAPDRADREATPNADDSDEERALRVLLVEDNPANQQVVQLILASCGVELKIADNGRIGVDAWRDELFDIVLMDMQMPVMDGLSAVREIRRIEAEHPRRGRTPIAMLSANAMEHHRKEALSAGADAHLAKPITPATLIAGIGAVLQLERSAA